MEEDQLLVKRILNGEESAFKELIQANQRLVYHMVNRLIDLPEDREDLCQEIFLKVFKKLPDFRFQSRLSTWIATIAYRAALNYLKKANRQRASTLEDVAFNLKDDQTSADIGMHKERLNQHIHHMISQLPPHYQTVLTLYHMEEMPYAEIAKVCDMPEGTVKNYIFRARKLLKERIEKVYIKEELL